MLLAATVEEMELTTQQMEAIGFSQISLIYGTVQCHVQEEHNLKISSAVVTSDLKSELVPV